MVCNKFVWIAKILFAREGILIWCPLFAGTGNFIIFSVPKKMYTSFKFGSVFGLGIKKFVFYSIKKYFLHYSLTRLDDSILGWYYWFSVGCL